MKAWRRKDRRAAAQMLLGGPIMQSAQGHDERGRFMGKREVGPGLAVVVVETRQQRRYAARMAAKRIPGKVGKPSGAGEGNRRLQSRLDDNGGAV